MKTTNLDPEHQLDVTRGRKNPQQASGSGVTVRDSTTTAGPIWDITVIGGTWTDNGDGTAVLTIGETAGEPGTSLYYVLKTEGGQYGLVTSEAAGATETLNLIDGSVWDLTLTANCTITITGATAGYASQIAVILRQGGVGSYTVTWPATVDWQNPLTGVGGGSAPTLFTAIGAQNVVVLTTLDGGVSWGGSMDSSSGGITVKEEGVALATTGSSLDFVGSGVVASGTGAAKTITIAGVTAAAVEALGFVGQILISDTPSTPLVFADLIQNEAEDDLVYADL